MFEIPLQKIDEERRLVIGQAAAEVLDKSGESMDYATAKAAFQEWSAEFERHSGGLSKGNLRVMHTKEVAGKIVDLSFDDLTKAVNIVAHVASPNAWALVTSGAFCGFSIGGGYARRWTEEGTGLKKYTPIVREISLVDNPCIPTARFVELIKADGIVEQLELRGAVRTFAQEWETRPRTFSEIEAERPRTFGELHKGIAGQVAAIFSNPAVPLGANHSGFQTIKSALGGGGPKSRKPRRPSDIGPLPKAGGMPVAPKPVAPLAKAAGELSEAQHQERINAAKARWAKEGGDTKAMEAHYTEQHDAAKSAWFGSKTKVAAVEAGHKQEWSDMADLHEAYDKAKPHLPADAHGLTIMHPNGMIHDPENMYGQMMKPGFDFEKKHVYGLAPHEVDDFVKEWKAKAAAAPVLNHDWHQWATGLKQMGKPGSKLHQTGTHVHELLSGGLKPVRRAKPDGSVDEHLGPYARNIPTKPHQPLAVVHDGKVIVNIAHPAMREDRDGLNRKTTPDEDEMILHGRGPLMKKNFITGDWSESAHPRGKAGKFAGKGSAPAAPSETTAAAVAVAPKRDAEGRKDETKAAWAGFSGGMLVSGKAAQHVPTLADSFRFGVGEKGKRNKTAASLRGDNAGRAGMKGSARRARAQALAEAPTADTAATSAHRKVMQEAAERGSSREEAEAMAARFAEKLRGRGKGGGTVGDMYVNGKPTVRVTPQAAASATRAVKNHLRGQVLTEKYLRGGLSHAVGGKGIAGKVLGYAARVPFGVLGAVAGAQAAHRLQREDEGSGVTDAHHTAANVGEALHLAGEASTGASIGGFAGMAASHLLQGGSLTSPFKSWMDGTVNAAKLGRASKIGGIVGAAGMVAMRAPDLIREYKARNAPKQES